jgi:mRNA interferase HigB
VIVTRTNRLEAFGRSHRDAAPALGAWLQVVTAATWRNPAEARATYRSLDPTVPVASGRSVAVFNIKGNRYRLVAGIDYRLGVVNVLRVMTHREYSRDKWKEQL